jgi:hypothetical protein
VDFLHQFSGPLYRKRTRSCLYRHFAAAGPGKTVLGMISENASGYPDHGKMRWT